jgi:hypothetical protein
LHLPRLGHDDEQADRQECPRDQAQVLEQVLDLPFAMAEQALQQDLLDQEFQSQAHHAGACRRHDDELDEAQHRSPVAVLSASGRR